MCNTSSSCRRVQYNAKLVWLTVLAMKAVVVVVIVVSIALVVVTVVMANGMCILCVGGDRGDDCGANNDNCGTNSENTDGYCGGALVNDDNKEEWMVYTPADNTVGGFNGENNGSVICTGIGRVCGEILWLLKTTPTSLPDTSKRT